MVFEKYLYLMLNVLSPSNQNLIMKLKEAINIAKAELEDIFEDENPRDIRLEEVDKNNLGSWVITLSYLQAPDARESMGLMAIAAAINVNTRAYKLVTVNQSGEVESIKIRKNG